MVFSLSVSWRLRCEPRDEHNVRGSGRLLGRRCRSRRRRGERTPGIGWCWGRGPFCPLVRGTSGISSDRIGPFCRWQFLALSVRLEIWQSVWFWWVGQWGVVVLFPISAIVGKLDYFGCDCRPLLYGRWWWWILSSIAVLVLIFDNESACCG